MIEAAEAVLAKRGPYKRAQPHEFVEACRAALDCIQSYILDFS
jgi:hypothetical protein